MWSTLLTYTPLTLLALLALLALYTVYTLVRLARADADLSTLSAWESGAWRTNMAGKRIWVTGASYGIGAALAHTLAVDCGAAVLISARSEDKLRIVAEQGNAAARAAGSDGSIAVLQLDLMDTDSHPGAAAAAVDILGGPIDILVNNAGRSQRALIEETPLEVDKAMIDLNVLGTLSLTKAVLPGMLAAGGGLMAVTSSVAGKMPVPVSGSYALTKHAVNGFFGSLGAELGSRGIDVCIVCPGPVVSEGAANAFTADPQASVGQAAAEPMKRHKMPTARCAELYAAALGARVYESWISQHPVLLFTYVAQYMPSLLFRLGRKMAAKRVAAFKSGDMGYSSFSLSSFLASALGLKPKQA